MSILAYRFLLDEAPAPKYYKIIRSVPLSVYVKNRKFLNEDGRCTYYWAPLNTGINYVTLYDGSVIYVRRYV